MGSLLLAGAFPVFTSLTERIMAAEPQSTVTALLTGGGFVLLAALMGGLFLMNKNRADGAHAIAMGAKELVGPLREELSACRQDMGELRGATENLIDAVDTLISRAQPTNGHEVVITVTRTEVTAVKSATSEARRHLN